MIVSTHVLDTRTGTPAAGMEVQLERWNGDGWLLVDKGYADDDGRAGTDANQEGMYRLLFNTGKYFEGQTFYPSVMIVFHAADRHEHYHVPLLLSPFGYSTYRGS